MKAIKITAFQESANYKVPISHDFRESYPLPPYSTIIGMVHYLCDFKEYHPMKVSIQGSYGSTTSDLYTEYEFKNGMKFESKRHQLNVNGFGISRGVAQVQLMTDVHLVLHIIPDDQSEVEDIYNCLKYPREYPNIGRREDLAVFENVEIVEISETKTENNFTSGEYLFSNKSSRKNWAAYIPVEYFKKYKILNFDRRGLPGSRMGTKYLLNKTYSLKQLPRKKGYIRDWEKQEAIYTEFYLGRNSVICADDKGDIVFAI